MIAAQILFAVIAVSVLIFAFRNANKWSKALQDYYVKEGGKRDSFMASGVWSTNFFRIILKIGIIFAAVVLTLMTYGLIFGSAQL